MKHCHADASRASYIWFGRMPADWYIAFVVIVAFGRMSADWYNGFAAIVAFAGWFGRTHRSSGTRDRFEGKSTQR